MPFTLLLDHYKKDLSPHTNRPHHRYKPTPSFQPTFPKMPHTRNDYTPSQLATAFDEAYSLYKSAGYSPLESHSKARQFVQKLNDKGYDAKDKYQGRPLNAEYKSSRSRHGMFDYQDDTTDALPRINHKYNLRSKSRYEPEAHPKTSHRHNLRGGSGFGSSSRFDSFSSSPFSSSSSWEEDNSFDKFRARTGLFGESSRTPFSSTSSGSGGFYFTDELRPGNPGEQRDGFRVPPRSRPAQGYKTKERTPSNTSPAGYTSSLSSSYKSSRYSRRGYSSGSSAYSSNEYSSPPWSASSSHSSSSSYSSSSRGYGTEERRPGGYSYSCRSSSSSSSSSYNPPRSFYTASARPSTPPPRTEPSGVKPDVCLYVVLGVPRTATSSEIKKAHRKLSMEWHPDRVRGGDKEFATEKMAQINRANDVLRDEKARAFYDRTGEIPGVEL